MTVLAIVFGIGSVVLLLYLFCAFPGDGAQAARFKNVKFAHRGLHGSVPENTVAAFKKVIEAGCGIELDVWLTSDGELIVFHDKNTKRMCGGKGLNVAESTYERLSELKLMNTSHKIPLLSQVLELVDGKVPLLIEIKCAFAETKVCEPLKLMLDGYNGDYCIESFNPLALRYFKKHSPETVRGQLSSCFWKERKSFKSLAETAVALLMTNFLSRPHFIAYDRRYLNSLPVKLCRTFGALVFAWTVKDSDIEKTNADAFIFEMNECGSKR